MPNSSNFVLLQLVVAGLLIAFLLRRVGTAFIGLTLLFFYSVFSSTLSAFSVAMISGVSASWVTEGHEAVFSYSGWSMLVMAAALWTAWGSAQGAGTKFRHTRHKILPTELQWLTPFTIYFLLGLGATAQFGYSFLRDVPTVNTVVAGFPVWSNVAVLLALVRWILVHDRKPIVIVLAFNVPVALLGAFASGHSPVKISLLLPAFFILAFFRGIHLRSVVYLSVGFLVGFYLMFAWMSSRSLIRQGHLDGMPLLAKVEYFGGEFGKHLDPSQLSTEAVLDLLLLRIDMSRDLALQVEHMPGGEPFANGSTIFEGLYALVPRALWPGKPQVAGGSEFVTRFSGQQRPRDDTTSIGIPVQFELYANGGPVWVWTGLFIITWMVARLERWVFTCSRPDPKWIFPAILVLMSLGGIQKISLVLASVVSGWIGMFALLTMVEAAFPGVYARLAGRRQRMRPASPFKRYWPRFRSLRSYGS